MMHKLTRSPSQKQFMSHNKDYMCIEVNQLSIKALTVTLITLFPLAHSMHTQAGRQA